MTRTTKQAKTTKIYGIVHPDIKDIIFAFNATGDADATNKTKGWNRYHGFTGSAYHNFVELDPQSKEATWLHNEWMR